MDIREVNVLVLAYIGDGVYENHVRHFLVENKGVSVDQLQSSSVSYVSAKSQANFLKILMERNFFTADELDVIKRARNYKNRKNKKNCDIITYKHATALEAIIGYLDLVGEQNRIKCIMDLILGGNLC